MPPATIAQLIIALGPPAIGLIKRLVEVWNKPTLSKEEVLTMLQEYDKSYDDYIKRAEERLGEGNIVP